MGSARVWLPIVLCVTVIWTMSRYGTVPDLTPWLTIQQTMILGHIALYSCLGFFAARYLSRRLGIYGATGLILSTALCAMFGIGDELHQRFVENRSADLDDLVADLVGGFVGSLLYVGWAAVTGSARKSEGQAAVQGEVAPPHRAAGLTLFLLFLFPVVVYSGIAAAIPGFLAEEVPLLAKRLLSQYIGSSVPAHPAEESLSADHVVSTEDKSRKVIGMAPDQRGALSSQSVHKTDGGAETPGRDTMASLPPKDVGPPVVEASQQPSRPQEPEKQAAAERAKTDLQHRVEHLSGLYKELAELETKEIQMVAYGPDYPPRLALREKIEVFREKILRSERDPIPPEMVARIKTQYTAVFKNELSRLEIKDLHMSKYSRHYPPRALLQEKMEFLRKKIVETEEGPHPPAR